MSIFTLIEINTVKGVQKFYKLSRDNVCEFDEFEIDARKNYNIEMNKIYHRMDLLSRREMLPGTQFKVLKGGIKYITECEIKSKNLRVYFIIDNKSGNVIIAGGYKKNQKKDINHFRNITREYLNLKGEYL